jgi:hypothetical protein
VFRFVSLPVFPDGRAEGDQNSGGTISVGQNDLAIFRHFWQFFAIFCREKLDSLLKPWGMVMNPSGFISFYIPSLASFS